MFNLQKIFSKEWDSNTSSIIITLLGLKLKFHKKNSFSSVYIKLEDLEHRLNTMEYILNNHLDIKNSRPATGLLKDIQDDCTNLLKIIKKICEENNLTYWLDAGSLLGAIRHKGFVPWDCDIDLCMPRNDYNKILKLLKKEYFDTRFDIRLISNIDYHCQIRIANKTNNTGLDIFPMDYYYKDNLNKTELEEITVKIKKAREAFETYCFEHSELKDLNLLETTISKIQNSQILQNHSIKPTAALFYGIDYPYDSKNYLIYNNDEIFPLQQLKFEDEYYNVPNHYESYLKNIYGNYNTFPKSIEKIIFDLAE